MFLPSTKLRQPCCHSLTLRANCVVKRGLLDAPKAA